VGADFLGQAIIAATAITGGKVYDAWLDLMDETGTQQMFGHGIKGKMRPSRVHISLQFVPVDASSASGGIAGEVPRTYFPLRPGGRVTLYHDAVCKPGPVDGIPLSGGGLYSESCCWDDMYQAIQEARR
jgi:phospholipase D1/2